MAQRKTDGMAKFSRQNLAGRFCSAQKYGNPPGPKVQPFIQRRAKPWYIGRTVCYISGALRCSAQRANSLPELTNGVRVGLKMNFLLVGPDVAGNKKRVWCGRCTRASPFVGEPTPLRGSRPPPPARHRPAYRSAACTWGSVSGHRTWEAVATSRSDSSYAGEYVAEPVELPEAVSADMPDEIAEVAELAAERSSSWIVWILFLTSRNFFSAERFRRLGQPLTEQQNGDNSKHEHHSGVKQIHTNSHETIGATWMLCRNSTGALHLDLV